MPLVFLLSGIIFLFITFDVIAFKNKCYKFFSVIALGIFMLGFFVGNIEWDGISFNAFHVIVYATLFCLFAYCLNLNSALRGVLIILIFLLIGLVDEEMNAFSGMFPFICIFISVWLSHGYFQKISSAFFVGSWCYMINCFYEYDMLTLVSVDFVYLLTVIIEALLLDVIINKFIGGVCNEKKNNCNGAYYYSCSFTNVKY